MFISCPHCRDLVATDPKTRLPPPLCPRCGGEMRPPAQLSADDADARSAHGRSFVSFLQAGADAPATSTPAEIPVAETVAETVTDPDAEQTLAETIPESAGVAPAEPVLNELQGAEASGEPDTATPVTGTEQEVSTDAADELLKHQEAVVETTQASAVAAQVQAAPHLSPSFTRRPATIAVHPRAAKWQWATLAVLSLLLLLQVLIADRARLAADANMRPVITHLCDALGCSVPAWHQPGALTMLSRDVRSIAGTPGGLQVQATFRNDAPWPQAWPLLVLSLSDADGRVVGSRAFSPQEYLGKGATQSVLAPGQSAGIALQLHEPSPGVVAFSFSFR